MNPTMKTLLIAFALFATSFTKSFANGGDVNNQVLQSFSNTFATAKEVSWTFSDNLYKAQFLLNDQGVTAYYQADGTMVALTRNISSLQLPIALQVSLKKEYNNLWITDLFEISNEEGTNYYVTLENGDNKVVLKSSSATSWNVFQKTRKG